MGKKWKMIIHFTPYNTLRRPHYQNKGPCKAQLRWGPIMVIPAAEAGYSTKNPKFSLLGTYQPPGTLHHGMPHVTNRRRPRSAWILVDLKPSVSNAATQASSWSKITMISCYKPTPLLSLFYLSLFIPLLFISLFFFFSCFHLSPSSLSQQLLQQNCTVDLLRGAHT